MSSAETKIINRALKEIQAGMVVNLGIGIPTKIVDILPVDFKVCLHSENGISGMGATLPNHKANRNLIDAGGAYVSPIAGSAYFDSAVSFALVRNGRLDLTLLGAFEISQYGDLANWKIPGKFAPGAGGAIELAQKAKRVVVLTTHQNKKGKSKLVEQCSLPLTAAKCVNRLITEMAVIDINEQGFTLVEISKDITVEEVCTATDAPLKVSDNLLEF